MSNTGKIFEEDFKKSCPEYFIVKRLKDSAQSYIRSCNTKYSWDNECDFYGYDTKSMLFYALELKSTKSKSISWQKDENDKSKRMIKYHQIKSLCELGKFNHVVSGFLFNYRDEKNDTQRTYFIDINNFLKMKNKTNKCSCDEIDIILNGAIKLDGNKKRTRWKWNVEEFIVSIIETYGGIKYE